ncbi:Glycosyl transferase family 2 [Marinobacter gudaonensis]|uniref:Glycosyl transferase family 2 n=1 Tax=Marinobacter gudaonensis TaxID=375760 RepID=A0A1I6GDN5_9GAMM|nr:glycosyltransferase [Marinobacter gudaonensis]SFR40296.1 Glycosyl transferase family 2 [Marinobacter gudaonensis]
METEEYPFVSIVIPAYNEGDHIGKCLAALISQNYPDDRYEIIVVDNGSSDNTVAEAQRFDVRVLSKPAVKVGAVRNFGVAHSRGDILAFIDSDCIAQPNWLSAGVSALKKENVGAVGGGCLLREEPSWIEKGWKLGKEGSDEQVTSLAGGSFLVKANLFRKLNGFDESINAGEDTKLSRDIASLGYRLLFLKECFVVHLGYPTTIKGFFKREYWHSSSYLNSQTGFNDLMFFSVLAFTFSNISLLIYLLSQDLLVLYGAAFLVISPFMFLVKNIKKVGIENLEYRRIPSAVLVSYIYYYGRSCGLINSCINVIADTFKSKKKA